MVRVINSKNKKTKLMLFPCSFVILPYYLRIKLYYERINGGRKFKKTRGKGSEVEINTTSGLSISMI